MSIFWMFIFLRLICENLSRLAIEVASVILYMNFICIANIKIYVMCIAKWLLNNKTSVFLRKIGFHEK